MRLADGSTLEINTDSTVRYRLTTDLRELTLAKGEARFKVAHDTSRPFVVSAGNTSIRAVGTEFTVRIRETGKVEVVVAEGVVAIRHDKPRSPLLRLLYQPSVPLTGGVAIRAGRMITDQDGQISVVRVSRSKIDAHDAWRTNALIFDGTPLAEIVAEFNRYNRQKLEVADPAIANIPIGGRYTPRDVDAFLARLGTVMKIRVTQVQRGGSAPDDDSRDGSTIRIYGAPTEPPRR
jgi:transmembrane sensor